MSIKYTHKSRKTRNAKRKSSKPQPHPRLEGKMARSKRKAGRKSSWKRRDRKYRQQQHDRWRKNHPLPETEAADA